APEYGWDDYAGLDMTGRTAVILVNDPGYATRDEDLFNGNAMTYYGRWTYKYEEAMRQGADGAIIIHQTAPASYGWNVVSSSWQGAQYDLETDSANDRVPVEGWIT
ncbi:MAG TPA: peptidase M28, partial [Alphaproteobacteria bacterium]|nr:peptidase M28 [Alphaproteobacteria bacterium]